MDEGIVLVEDHEGQYVALYIDGELVVEGSSISERDMLTALGCEFAIRYTRIEDNLPDNLEDFEFLDENRAEF